MVWIVDESMRGITASRENRRLVSAQAYGVLGEFDHRFDFESPGSFAIVYGPNGVGKTRVLEIINALCNLNVMRLVSLPFRSAQLLFTDGSKLQVTRVPGSNKQEDAVPENVSDQPDDIEYLTFRLWVGGSLLIESRVSALKDFKLYLQETSPYEPTADMEIWIDPSDGERVTFQRLQRMYLSRFQARNPRRGAKNKSASEVDPAIQAFAESLDVRLIETQRLIGQGQQYRERNEVRHPFRDDTQQAKPTIIQYSEQIKLSLDNNLSANSRLSQSLDSTFPRRMLERGDRSALTEDELRAKWAHQTTRRARLTEIADLNVDPELSLPTGSLNPWQLGMLELYLADADAKLDSFSDVLKRIDLLEAIVNTRLLGKSLHIDANNGLVVTRKRDRASVPLTALSSGEQHEIILMFDLLFNVQPGSVVMIDEPEISLHIGWQKKFIADVLRISALVGFQFVVATHSPQIIDRWWKYATKLGPTSSDFLGEEEIDSDA